MTWSKIAELVKRLDSHLSDAVYVHGCYLTGQQDEFCRHRQAATEDHPYGHTSIKQVQVREVAGTDAQKDK
jgi:hypothetical protein